jgi:molybdopterin molybdotransferase
MAGLNISSVDVYKKPTIAVASTGDEILDVGEKQTNISQIRGTNHLTMEAIAIANGCDVMQLGIIKDNQQTIKDMYNKALHKADIVVTTGGVSVGDYDFVKDIIKFELGASVLFHGVAIKPGQHIVVAKLKNKIIVGLPGFAYSSTVTFLLYVVPLIYKLQGVEYKFKTIKTKALFDMPATYEKAVFTACDIENVDGYFEINIKNKKQGSSAILTNLVGQTCLLYQKPNTKAIQKGDTVEVLQI